jgi:DNA polymerase-3 subunit alpha
LEVFYSRELYFHELKKTGATLHLPCVNESDYLTSIHGSNVHIGFIHVQGLEEALILQLIDERTKNGNYQHLQDFIERIKPGIEQLKYSYSHRCFPFFRQEQKGTIMGS